jgi:aspartyl-tRNA(Asn)/glutamyl-tRNA(Gln) amidotransferase subunit A
MYRLSALEIRDAFRKGEVSAKEIIESFLGRIDQYDGELGCFLSVLKDRALAQAKKLDEKRASGKPLGRLAGIPIGMKDNIHVNGELSTCASKFLTNYHAVFDATVVKLLELEDAIIIGKTNMDEFAMGSSTEHSALKKTRNPWNLDCVPGGSSGGSAAAVAARLCPIAFGSDTGGSIRQPASFCGVVGFKPSYGRVSRYGLVAFGSSLDQIGPLANNTQDIGLIMEVIGKHCEKDSTSVQKDPQEYLSQFNGELKGVKIGVPWHFIEGLSEESRKNFDESLSSLKDQGCEIIDVDLDTLKHSIAVYYILATAEASTNLARFDGVRYGQRSKRANTLAEVYDYSKEEGFGEEVKRRILLGTYVLSTGYQDAFYRKAQKVRTLIIEQYKKVFKQCDIVAMPVVPSPAFEIGAIKNPLEMYLADIYTISANLAGIPAISVPSGFSADKKPLGLQLQAAQLQDVNLCRVANAFEKTHQFTRDVPECVKEGEAIS